MSPRFQRGMRACYPRRFRRPTEAERRERLTDEALAAVRGCENCYFSAAQYVLHDMGYPAPCKDCGGAWYAEETLRLVALSRHWQLPDDSPYVVYRDELLLGRPSG